jgi:hypothetical protein
MFGLLLPAPEYKTEDRYLGLSVSVFFISGSGFGFGLFCPPWGTSVAEARVLACAEGLRWVTQWGMPHAILESDCKNHIEVGEYS